MVIAKRQAIMVKGERGTDNVAHRNSINVGEPTAAGGPIRLTDRSSGVVIEQHRPSVTLVDRKTGFVEMMNERPRKRLGYRTPRECFESE